MATFEAERSRFPSGAEAGDGGYEDGATAKLGPSNLRHHDDGSVTIDGEEVDDPDEYKGEPIPGGPSDPDAPPDPAMDAAARRVMWDLAELLDPTYVPAVAGLSP